MKKNLLKLLILCLTTLILQNCSKNNLKTAPEQQADAIVNTTGLQLNSVGSTGVYQFIAYNGGSAGVANKSTSPGNPFSFIAFTGSAFQKWQITQVSANGFTIRNTGSNLYIQSYNYDGRPVLVQAPYTGDDDQVWIIASTGAKAYKITNKANGLAITASADAFYQLQTFANRPTQVWRYNQLTPASTGIIKDRKTIVYFGVPDEGNGKTMAEQSDPANYSKWEYVRQNADGYYQNFITMHANSKTANPLGNIQKMAAAYTNKNCFFETSRETQDGNSEATDKQWMDLLTTGGFTVNNTSFYNVDKTSRGRVSTLQNYNIGAGTKRICLTGGGPWTFSGDINRNAANNATIRDYTENYSEGISLDGPMGFWSNNQGRIKEGTVSAIKFARQKGKLSAMMLAPSPFFGTDPNYNPFYNFLTVSKDCVLYCEDHQAAPDQWHVWTYQPLGTPTFPEKTVVNGQNVPSNTLTGVAYWLIKHLNTLPLMQIPNTGSVGNNTTVRLVEDGKARIILNNTGNATDSYSMLINFSNSPDREIELSPVISAVINGAAADWEVTFKLDTTDVTHYITKTGLNCISFLRLTKNFTLPLTMHVKALTPSAAPIAVNFTTAANIAHTGNKLNYAVIVKRKP